MPVNIHSWDWAWYSYAPFKKAGLPNPKNFEEFVADAPKLKEAGFIAMAIGGDGNGWQIKGAFDQILLSALGIEGRDAMYRDKDLKIAGGPDMLKALTEFKSLKQYTDEGYANRNWNDTTNLVITGKAGLQIMGDWARGEFSAAGMTGVKDYGCMIGLNEDKPVVTTDGDVIVFPKQSDPAVEAAQKRLAKLLISPAVQVAFNNAKGSMPVRGDVDMATADPCMQKALKAVEDPAKIATSVQRFTNEDTNNELNALVSQFWSDDCHVCGRCPGQVGRNPEPRHLIGDDNGRRRPATGRRLRPAPGVEFRLTGPPKRRDGYFKSLSIEGGRDRSSLLDGVPGEVVPAPSGVQRDGANAQATLEDQRGDRHLADDCGRSRRLRHRHRLHVLLVVHQFQDSSPTTISWA